MKSIPVYGEEVHFLEKESGLSYDASTIYNHAPRHTHNFYEFFLVTDGLAYHMINDAVQTVTRGDLYFIRPRDIHCYNFYHSENFRVLNLGFTLRIFENICLLFERDTELERLTGAPIPPSCHLAEEDFYRVQKLLTETGALLKEGAFLHARYHAQCVIALLLEQYFFSYSSGEESSSMPLWLQTLLAEMSRVENFQEGYGKMCSLAPCSPSHLCRVLRQATGQTPTQYINRQRLTYAVYLLTQTDSEILGISTACGFSNLSHFYHLFREAYGCSPARFRKDHS